MRLATVLFFLLGSPAFAQVSVNQGALDQLHPAAPAATPAPAHPATHPAATHPAATKPTTHPPATHPSTTHPAHAPTRPAAPAAAHPATAAKPPRFVAPARPVTVAPAAPPVAVLPPPVQPTIRPTPAPPPVPVVNDAAGEATKLPNGGVRITFGAGAADLNPATMGAIQELARSVRDKPNADLNLYAYAAGVPDDPSTPRRVSLSRALAVRAVMISEGIVSTRIYPRALGAPPDGPPDRLDVTAGPSSGAPPPGLPAPGLPAPGMSAPGSPGPGSPGQ